MLKIGDFSKLAQVTVKALRHYDQIGILKPAWTDRFSSYRYYTIDQMPRLNRILALKDLGFTLDQITQLLDEQLSAEQLCGIVLSKRVEVERRVQEEQLRLNRVEARLKQIEQEGRLPAIEVVLKKVEPQVVASARDVVPSAMLLPERYAVLRNEVNAWLHSARLHGEGPWIVAVENPEYVDHDITVDVSRAIEERVKPHAHGQVSIAALPGAEMACAAYPGSGQGHYQVYAAFYTWGDANSYRLCGPIRELYLEEDDGATAGGQLVEIQFPVEPILWKRFHQGFEFYDMESAMEPKFVTKPAFLAAGTMYQGKNEGGLEIRQVWEKEFLPRMHELERVDPYVAYGVCRMAPGLPEGEFQYLCAVEVADGERIPEGMVTWEMSEQTYAVFAHQGSQSALMDTYASIYQKWLPQSGYELTGEPDFEMYTNEFHDFSEDSIMYLYVPVRKKAE